MIPSEIIIKPPAAAERLREYGRLGCGFMQGAMLAVIPGLLFVVAMIVATALWGPTDATDNGAYHRSGFALRTDYGTGCQYLQAGGALTPRLDATGHQICGGR